MTFILRPGTQGQLQANTGWMHASSKTSRATKVKGQPIRPHGGTTSSFGQTVSTKLLKIVSKSQCWMTKRVTPKYLHVACLLSVAHKL